MLHIAFLSLVSALLASRGPSHVAWLIVTVVVYPIQAKVRSWARTYMSEKFFKGVEAKLNASSAIMLIVPICRPSAPVLGGVIASKFRRAVHAVSFDAANLPTKVLAIAAARLYSPLAQFKANSLNCCPAGAFTGPFCGASIAFPARLNSCEASELLAGNILGVFHTANICRSFRNGKEG